MEIYISTDNSGQICFCKIGSLKVDLLATGHFERKSREVTIGKSSSAAEGWRVEPSGVLFNRVFQFVLEDASTMLPNDGG